MQSLPVVVLGFLFGMLHATAADHIVAVSTIVSRLRSLGGAARIGALWGVGHTLTVFLVGGAIILFNLAVSPRFALVTELGVALMLRLSVIALLVYGGLIGLTYLGFRAVPAGFIPEQDKGYLVVNAQLPDGASLERSDEVIARMTAIARKIEGVGHTISVPGYSILTARTYPTWAECLSFSLPSKSAPAMPMSAPIEWPIGCGQSSGKSKTRKRSSLGRPPSMGWEAPAATSCKFWIDPAPA